MRAHALHVVKTGRVEETINYKIWPRQAALLHLTAALAVLLNGEREKLPDRLFENERVKEAILKPDVQPPAIEALWVAVIATVLRAQISEVSKWSLLPGPVDLTRAHAWLPLLAELDARTAAHILVNVQRAAQWQHHRDTHIYYYDRDGNIQTQRHGCACIYAHRRGLPCQNIHCNHLDEHGHCFCSAPSKEPIRGSVTALALPATPTESLAVWTSRNWV